MTEHEHHSADENPLSNIERGILLAFRDMNVPAGMGVPTDMLGYRMSRIDGFVVGQGWQLESAFVSLQVRGLIQPGDDPFSAVMLELTPGGHEFVHSAEFAAGKSP
jgi:hypothetical protein